MIASHKKHERYILEGFRRDYAQQFRTRCELVAQRESPDAELRVGENPVLVELAEYREQGPRLAAQEWDRRLKRFLLTKWRRAQSRLHWSITLTYHVRNEYYQIPSTANDQAALLFTDLRRILPQLQATQTREFMTYQFVHKHELADYQLHGRLPDRRYVAKESWPHLSQFCQSIRLFHHPKTPSPSIRSSLDTFATALDTCEIERLVRGKLKKAENYRKEMPPGQHLWLLLYSEGWNPTGRIHDKRWLARARDIIRSLAPHEPGSPHRFDAIWWADEVEQKRGKIYRMDQ